MFRSAPTIISNAFFSESCSTTKPSGLIIKAAPLGTSGVVSSVRYKKNKNTINMKKIVPTIFCTDWINFQIPLKNNLINGCLSDQRVFSYYLI